MKKLITMIIFIGLSIALAYSSPESNVETASQPEVIESSQQTEIINKVQRYLDGLKRLKAKLVQTNPDGSVMLGTLYLDRPGKMRLEYSGASQTLMIADGENFIYQEADQSPVSYSIDSTPAGILLRKSLRLQEDIKVLGISKWAGTIAITLARPDDDDSTALTLMFKEHGTTISLLGWSLRQQDRQTNVALKDQEVPKALDPELFKY